jgi:hypothetical protein
MIPLATIRYRPALHGQLVDCKPAILNAHYFVHDSPLRSLQGTFSGTFARNAVALHGHAVLENLGEWPLLSTFILATTGYASLIIPLCYRFASVTSGALTRSAGIVRRLHPNVLAGQPNTRAMVKLSLALRRSNCTVSPAAKASTAVLQFAKKTTLAADIDLRPCAG